MSQKISTGLGVVIIIIISLTAGVFVWESYKIDLISYQQPATMKLPIKEKNMTENRPDEATDWQTYQDKKNGFEIKYPSAKIKEDNQKSKLFVFSDEGGQLLLFIDDNVKEIDAQGIKNKIDYYKNDIYRYKYQESFIDISGVKSYKQETLDSGVIENYYISKNKKTYNFRFEFNFDLPNDNLINKKKNLIRKIMSTFKLTYNAAKSEEISSYEATRQFIEEKKNKENDELKKKTFAEQETWKEMKADQLCKNPNWTTEDCKKLVVNKIWIGMSYAMLIEIWGSPNHANALNPGYRWCWTYRTPTCFYDVDADGLVDRYN